MSDPVRTALRVHRSNRMERLVDVLAEICRGPSAPFEPETIVVASKGLERWLAMQLAGRFGIWANARYPFPRAFIDEAFDAVLGPLPPEQGFSREVLGWAVAAELPRHLDDPAFAELRGYLRGGDLALRLGLAERIAYVFDQYAVYRPELVLGWQAGSGDDWQARLWRALSARLGAEHFAQRARRFFETWRRGGALPAALPRRASIVGVSALPPLYLRVFSALAQCIDLHLLLLMPSREHTGDVRSATEITRALQGSPASAESLHLFEGNALFASLGKSARDLAELLETTTEYDESEQDLFQEPGSKTMLACLQSDVLALRQRSPRSASTPPLTMSPLDRSITLHRCHSPLRQVEVLRDQLLAAFDADPSLSPSDVVVMMPDVEPFAPLIDAVFNVDPRDPAFIPYRVADRSLRAESVAFEAILAVLGVCRGRMKASEVLDLLELEPVRRRFGIATDQLPRLRRWVHESGIRWGVDAADRKAWGQPGLAENTWRFGLARLLVGYALPTQGGALWSGVLPHDDVEGDEAELLGSFVDFCERLFRWRERLAEPRPASAWRSDLEALFDEVLGDAPSPSETELFRTQLDELESATRRARFDDPLPLDVVERTLAERLRAERSSQQFLSGGVTFCALLPMRSIPFRVVCLLGLDDDAFPRKDRAPSFDLVANQPALGDRTLRHEDRYLFLESLLSARERLLVFYVGQGIRDGAERPPSVVVGDLLDALRSSFRVEARPRAGRQTELFALQPEPAERVDVAAHLTVCHPLQPFSPRYFAGDGALFSYAAAEARGAAALARPRRGEVPLLTRALPAAAATPRKLGIDELVRFFENPARGTLQQELGLFLEEDPCLIEDREPFEPTPLERYELGRTLLERALRDGTLDGDPTLLRASGALPLGTPGALYYQGLLPEVRAIVRAARRFAVGEPLEPLPFTLDVGSTSLTGTLGSLWPAAQVWARYSRVRAKTELAAWIRHLVLACVRAPDQPAESVLVGRPLEDTELVRCERFRPVAPDRARRHLAELIELYWAGRRSVLCLFPEPAKRYASVLADGDEAARTAALEAALEVYRSRPFSVARAASSDEYVERAFGAVNPLDPEFSPFPGAPPGFAELSERVFGPLLEHLEPSA